MRRDGNDERLTYSGLPPRLGFTSEINQVRIEMIFKAKSDGAHLNPTRRRQRPEDWDFKVILGIFQIKQKKRGGQKKDF